MTGFVPYAKVPPANRYKFYNTTGTLGFRFLMREYSFETNPFVTPVLTPLPDMRINTRWEINTHIGALLKEAETLKNRMMKKFPMLPVPGKGTPTEYKLSDFAVPLRGGNKGDFVESRTYQDIMRRYEDFTTSRLRDYNRYEEIRKSLLKYQPEPVRVRATPIKGVEIPRRIPRIQIKQEVVEPVETIHLSLGGIADYVSWRLLKDYEGLSFPFGRGPQNIELNYEEVDVTENELIVVGVAEQANGIGARRVLETMGRTKNEHRSVHGPNFINHQLRVSTAMGCVEHFYLNVRNSFINSYMTATEREWSEAVRAFYQIVGDDELVYNLGGRLRQLIYLTENHITQNTPFSVEDYRRVCKSLTALYTDSGMLTEKVRKRGYLGAYAMRPLYQKDGRDIAIAGMGFIANCMYRGTDREIIAKQDKHIGVPGFTDRVLAGRTEFMCVNYPGRDYYNEDEVSGAYVVQNYRGVAAFNRGVRGMAFQDGSAGSAARTVNLIKEKSAFATYEGDRFHHFFGDNGYELPVNVTIGNKVIVKDPTWYDNSRSGGLCGITSIVCNPLFRNNMLFKADNRKGLSNFVADVCLATNIYQDKVLMSVKKSRAIKVHKKALDMLYLKLRIPAKEVVVVHYVSLVKGKRGLTKDTKLYQYSSDPNGITSGYVLLKKKKDLEGLEKAININLHKIYVFHSDDHMFTVDNIDHLNYLVAVFKKGDLVPFNGDEVNVISITVIAERYRQMLSNKHNLMQYYKCWDSRMDFKSTWVSAEKVAELVEFREIDGEPGIEEWTQKGRELGLPYKVKTLQSIASIGCKKIMYVSYDVETFINEDKNSQIYGLHVCVHGSKGPVDFNSLGSGNTPVDQALIIDNFLYYIMKEAEARDVNNVKVYAHNGGKFDTLLARNIMVEDLLGSFSAQEELYKEAGHDDIRYTLGIDIIAGGMKLLTVSGFNNTRADLRTEQAAYYAKHMSREVKSEHIEELEALRLTTRIKDEKVFIKYPKPTAKIDISFVDSVCLLPCKLADASKIYGLSKDLYEKGAYPYKIYDHLINNGINKWVWDKDELITLEGLSTDAVLELAKYYKTIPEASEVDLIALYKDYCSQDVKILEAAIEKAHELFHAISVNGSDDDMIKEDDILKDMGGVQVIEKSTGEKVKKVSFKDSITIPGFAKSLSNYYGLSDEVGSFSGISKEYLSVYTGGLTYIRSVCKFESAIMYLIASNPYTYIKPHRTDLIAVFNKRGQEPYYDINKKKMTFDKNGEWPEEALLLVDLLKFERDACMMLFDCNSLYPSAIVEAAEFPIGAMTRFNSWAEIEEAKIKSGCKRIWFIAYFRVKFKTEAIQTYTRLRGENKPLPMHYLIIQTPEGNRHLTPEDAQCNSFGMTDVMYKAIVEDPEALYELELINGVYWDRGSGKICKLMRNLYETRKTHKAAGRDNLSTCVKLIMNSIYGFLLEKCHFVKSKYLDTRKTDKVTEVYDPGHSIFSLTKPIGPELEGHNNFILNKEEVFAPAYKREVEKGASDVDIHKRANHGVSDYNNEMGKFIRGETKSIEELDRYESKVHYGCYVLDSSKVIMDRFFKALNWDIYYSDTDSAFITNTQYNNLQNKENLIGDELSQFKSDFTDKVKGVGIPLDDTMGVVAIASIFIAKKTYCNALLFLTSDVKKVNPRDPEEMILDYTYAYITIEVRSAGKGVVHKKLSFEYYEALLNDNVEIKQDRVGVSDGPTFIVKGGAKSNKGIEVHTRGNPNRATMTRTIRNRDAVNKSRGITKKADREAYSAGIEVITQG